MAEEKNKVDVQLYDLTVTENPTDFFGRVRSKGTLDNFAIASRIKKEGTEYQLESMVEVLNPADRIKSEGLASGYNINTGIINARLGVQGVFYNASFDAKQHTLKGTVNLSSDARAKIADTGVTVLGQAQVGTLIYRVVDSFTGNVNSTLTPSNAAVVIGEKLEIKAEEAFADEVGAYFISLADESRTKCQIISSKNKELIILIPALAAGDYEFEVVTQWSNGTMLKEPRSERFDSVLKVD
ncbi:DNA-binding domain-containing protein [Saccharicrinis aurantiacus]|uniref:DNA-binding domain-containing protein n=1 Tax=Saccharicrinis aurantiacus TaxID=1849719 RepID=UPI0024905C1F|nr:DNA-binding domain-containing protein [Saccharicrinis aurantiacus]